MNLLLDIGNSRLKWAVESGGELSIGTAIAHSEQGVGDLSPLLSAAQGVRSAYISSTALSLTAPICQRISDALGCTTQVFVSPKERLGIRSAYDQPETLGSDRFLAMVGARTYVRGAFLVADAGTAMTLDMVDEGGQHLGGMIMPGPMLMRDALHRGTAGVRSGELTRLREFARNTDDAVWSGVCHACIALIGHAYRQAKLGVGGDVSLILAGGAMPNLAPHIHIPHLTLPHLVLDGLSTWARSAATST